MTPAEQYLTVRYAYLRQKYPSMPDDELRCIAKRIPVFKSTNGLTAAIISYVTYIGGYANRINSEGRKIKTKNGKDIYIPTRTRRGTADIDIIYQGKSIKVEVKNINTKDRLSERQIKEKQAVEAAGATYYIAETWEGFLSWWKQNIEK